MEISCPMDGCCCDGRGSQISLRFAWKTLAHGLGCVLLTLSLGVVAIAQSTPLVLERDGRVISLEPYAPNIVRVTMSIDKAAATGAPGYGFVAKPSAEGWTHERDADGGDVFRSARMVVRVAPGNLPADKLPQPMPLDALNRQLREVYFGGGGGQGPHNDALLVTTADRQDTAAHAHLDDGAGTRGRCSAGHGREGLLGCGYLRLARGRALLRTGAAAEGLDGPAGSRDPLLA